MSADPTLHERLARAADPIPIDVGQRLGALHGGRRSRVRRRRLTALAVAAAIAVVIVFLGWQTLPRGDQERPADAPITPMNVSSLRLSWSAVVGLPIDAPVVVSGGQVFVVSPGRLSVFPVSCAPGPGDCAPTWIAQLPGSKAAAWWGGVAVHGDRVYVGTSEGVLGFPTSCRGTCAPVWSASTSGSAVSASPVVAAGVVYVGVSGPGSAGHGALQAFSVSCSNDPCAPLWKADLPDQFLGATPAMASGAVFIGSNDGTLEALPLTCNQTGGRCAPRWKTSLAAGHTAGPMQTPLEVDGGELFAASGTNIYAVNLTCTNPGMTCPPHVIGQTAGLTVNVTPADGYVYATGYAQTAPYVFRAPCGTGGIDCPVRMDGAVGSAQYVGGGLAFVAPTTTSISAFRSDCAWDAPPCRPLWSAPTIGTVAAPATVVDGALYVGDESGHVYRFAQDLDAAALDPTGRSSRHGSSVPYALFYLALLTGGTLFAIRAYRRGRATRSLPIDERSGAGSREEP